MSTIYKLFDRYNITIKTKNIFYIFDSFYFFQRTENIIGLFPSITWIFLLIDIVEDECHRIRYWNKFLSPKKWHKASKSKIKSDFIPCNENILRASSKSSSKWNFS